MVKGFFITGTDTNIGKTVLSALLCAALQGRYWKSVSYTHLTLPTICSV